MRPDTNKVALRALQHLLAGARPFDVDINGTAVRCSVSTVRTDPWPTDLAGVVAKDDGPWPSVIGVHCAWPGGECRLEIGATYWTSGRYANDLCVSVRDERREIVFINVSNAVEEVEDGRTATLGVRFYVARKNVTEAFNAGLRKVLADSKLPILSQSQAKLCDVEVPSGSVLPSADSAFKALVQMALLKLDFLDRAGTRARGVPLVDVSALLGAAQVPPDDLDDVEPEREEQSTARQYWAGGFGEQARLQAFIAGNYWQIGWPRESEHASAVATWRQFAGIKVGDLFAIKGYGGKSDLIVHYVGEVLGTTPDGRVDLHRLDTPLFKGKGPTGKGAGNWFETLISVTRPDVIALLFGDDNVPAAADGDAAALPRAPLDLPLNLIYFGPPGTGKTYLLTSQLVPLFQRKPTKSDAHAALVADLTWVQVTALALEDLGKQVKVAALQAHPLIRAKYAASPMKAPLRQRLWAVLQSHTVEGSKTVQYEARAADQYFDKTEDSAWSLVRPLPDELREIARTWKGPTAGTFDDFRFITFHQAYGYEDFIEGIRPHLDAGEGEDAGRSLSYVLADGAFLRAVREALRIAGFAGSLHDFCHLTRAEREAQFRDAPPYAVFIDEINRGNVARIFGELITLLEDDKRLGEENEVIVDLPYSKQRFGVPPNLHVIGTMNTADRSIEALDTALRRRFEFREQPPRPELLDAIDCEGGIQLGDMLRAMNRRLEKLYDRDHCIGHAYLYALGQKPELSELRRVFSDKIIPLLQEYFYGDWGKIGLVLGKDFIRRRDTGVEVFADFEHDEVDALAQRVTWELADIKALSNLSFQRIYKHVPDA